MDGLCFLRTGLTHFLMTLTQLSESCHSNSPGSRQSVVPPPPCSKEDALYGSRLCDQILEELELETDSVRPHWPGIRTHSGVGKMY